MKQKLNFLFLFFLMAFTFLANGQSVDLRNVRYSDFTPIPVGTPIQIYQGTKRTISFELYLVNSANHSLTTGSLNVYSKKSASSSTKIIYATELFNSNNPVSNLFSKYYTIELNANNYNATGGTLYGEFTSSTNGESTFGNMFYIQVIPVPAITNNTISSDQTVEEGYSAASLYGTAPLGGLGTFTYQWQKKEGNGNWTAIQGATSPIYSPGIMTYTTKYRRVVKSGNATENNSNEITITVNPAPALINNSISILGSEITGSTPTGGTNVYTYKWLVFALEGEDPWVIEQNTTNYSIPANVYDFASFNNVYIARVVVSGRQTSTSNTVYVPAASEIANNFISVSGTDIVGSLPSGGTGSFRYEYHCWVEIDGEVIGDIEIVGTNQNYQQQYFGNFTRKFYRKVYSGNKVSFSNTVSISPLALKPLMKTNGEIQESLISKLNIYPNPTQGELNFSTNFENNTNVEIFLFSESLANEVCVFKGLVSPSQTVKWSIPSSYPTGIYFYRILSESKEVKSGKVLYQ